MLSISVRVSLKFCFRSDLCTQHHFFLCLWLSPLSQSFVPNPLFPSSCDSLLGRDGAKARVWVGSQKIAEAYPPAVPSPSQRAQVMATQRVKVRLSFWPHELGVSCGLASGFHTKSYFLAPSSCPIAQFATVSPAASTSVSLVSQTQTHCFPRLEMWAWEDHIHGKG